MTPVQEKPLNTEGRKQQIPKKEEERTPVPKKEKEGKRLPRAGEPEGFLVLMWAIFLDILGLIGLIPGLGQLLSYIVDILGTVTLGLWLWFKVGKLGATRGAVKRFKKRFVIGGVIEYIPILGIVPAWTVAILSILGKEIE